MTHVEALETTIDALEIQPIDAALVQLCRMTAKQMDAADGAPSTRLASIYLSLLRNLRKIGPTVERSNTLTVLRELRGRQAPTTKTRLKAKSAPDVG